jgi:hypothetical protein
MVIVSGPVDTFAHEPTKKSIMSAYRAPWRMG